MKSTRLGVGATWALVAAMAYFATACSPSNREVAVPASPAQDSAGGELHSTGTQSTSLEKLETNVGVRDFQQLYVTMAQLTQVPYTDATVSAAYQNSVAPLLPGQNEVKALAGPNVIALTRLASQFCDTLSGAADARRTALYPGLNAGGALSGVTPAIRDASIQALVSKFNPDVPSDQVNANHPMVRELVILSDDLKAKLPNTAAGTRGWMVGVCTAALAGARSLVLL